MRHLYSKWMYNWEHRLTTRDTNRIVRPLEFGLDWTRDWNIPDHPPLPAHPAELTFDQSETYLRDLNRAIIAHSDDFFSYSKPTDFRLETRLPELFPTNDRQTKQLLRMRRLADSGKLRRPPSSCASPPPFTPLIPKTTS